LSRIEEIIACAKSYQDRVEQYYDLYCDHGKMGEGLIDLGKPIYFNDRTAHLIDALKNSLGNGRRLHFSSELAQDLSFKPHSLIIAAGVGGLLMIECFESWKAGHSKEVWESLIFLVCPAYYDIELRNYLRKASFCSLEEWICKERSRFYDIQVIKAKGSEPRVGLLPGVFRPENEAIFREFALKQLNMLRAKREPSAADLWLIEQYEAL